MKFIHYNLWKAKRRLSSEAVFKRTLQKKLDRVWASNYGSTPWYSAGLMRLTGVGVLGVMLTGSFGTGAYAYVSPEVTEESVLYPVKEKIEAVEEKVLNYTPESKAKFYLKQIARREAETAVLQKRGRPVEKLQARVDKTEEKLMVVRSKILAVTTKQKEVQLKINKRLEIRQQRLKNQAEKLAERINKEVENEKSIDVNLSTTTKQNKIEKHTERRLKLEKQLSQVNEQLLNLAASSSVMEINVKIKASENFEKMEQRVKRVLEKKLKLLEKIKERQDKQIAPSSE